MYERKYLVFKLGKEYMYNNDWFLVWFSGWSKEYCTSFLTVCNVCILLVEIGHFSTKKNDQVQRNFLCPLDFCFSKISNFYFYLIFSKNWCDWIIVKKCFLVFSFSEKHVVQPSVQWQFSRDQWAIQQWQNSSIFTWAKWCELTMVINMHGWDSPSSTITVFSSNTNFGPD